MDFTKELIADLERTACQARQRHYRRGISERKIADELSVTPARQFYISYEYALRVLSRYRRRGCGLPRGRNRKEMFLEINSRADQCLARHPDWPLSRAIQAVLEAGNAPRYYFSPAALRRRLSEPEKYK